MSHTLLTPVQILNTQSQSLDQIPTHLRHTSTRDHSHRNPTHTTHTSNQTPSQTPSDTPTGNAPSGQTNPNRRYRRPPNRPSESSAGVGSSTTEAQTNPPSAPNRKRPNRNRNRSGQSQPQTTEPKTDSSTPPIPSSDTQVSQPPRKPGRRAARTFGSSLTEIPGGSQASTSAANTNNKRPSEKFRNTAPKKDDLTSTLIHALSTAPYPDCLICFSAIHPAQPTWSCSPSSPLIAASDDEGAGAGDGGQGRKGAQCCWTTFHLKCIRSWASTSVRQVAAAWSARGEDRAGDWRCPGCQSKRAGVPSSYWCFCGSTPEPKPPRLATPHSCASPCARARPCAHACPLACHPGPCPPCVVTTDLPCHCARTTLSFRCAQLGRAHDVDVDLSCGAPCGRPLACGRHVCERACHAGPCAGCEVSEEGRCWCGRSEERRRCGEVGVLCRVVEGGEERSWVGRFACEEVCDRLFDCGVHRCQKPCHPPSSHPAPCPRSPALTTHCPCGKHALSSSSAPHFAQGTLLPRASCADPIPTCESTCMRPLEGCAHPCAARCHAGPCPPCERRVVRACRCGAATRDVRCADLGTEEVLCERPCGALRACGKHQCKRLCCPLAALAGSAKKKGKGKGKSGAEEVLDDAGWHACDIVCARVLGCGIHRCEARDHKGACAPCLQSSFDEMVCHCGRTVLDPPIPCGTRISCPHPCARAPPACGHPKAPHACHPDDAPCPPCAFLTSKRCACGKARVPHVRCALGAARVCCGARCGRVMRCGGHVCERTCHAGECGDCGALCGKARRLCAEAGAGDGESHPCTNACHAPSACDEREPCGAIVSLACPCGRIVQRVACGRCTASPAGRLGAQLKCTNECAVARRNARLAEALGISPERRAGAGGGETVWKVEMVGFARANLRFCTVVERSFAEFLASDRKSQILPQMPETRRKFVQELAAVYRTDTLLIDQEPHTSVQLVRRIDSRVPGTLLSSVSVSGTSTSTPAPAHAHASSSTTGNNLGKLVDLRAQAPPPPPVHARAPAPAGRGWTSVVVREAGPVHVQAPRAVSPHAWMISSLSSSSMVPPTQPQRPLSGAGTAQSSGSRGPTPLPVHVPAVSVQGGGEDVPESWEDEPEV